MEQIAMVKSVQGNGMAVVAVQRGTAAARPTTALSATAVKRP